MAERFLIELSNDLFPVVCVVFSPVCSLGRYIDSPSAQDGRRAGRLSLRSIPRQAFCVCGQPAGAFAKTRVWEDPPILQRALPPSTSPFLHGFYASCDQLMPGIFRSCVTECQAFSTSQNARHFPPTRMPGIFHPKHHWSLIFSTLEKDVAARLGFSPLTSLPTTSVRNLRSSGEWHLRFPKNHRPSGAPTRFLHGPSRSAKPQIEPPG